MYSKEESLTPPPLQSPSLSTPPPPQSRSRSRITASYLAKRHTCTNCKRTFKRLQHLRQHVRHQCDAKTSKRFYCESCSTSFSRSDALKRHYKQIGHKTREAAIAVLKAQAAVAAEIAANIATTTTTTAPDETNNIEFNVD